MDEALPYLRRLCSDKEEMRAYLRLLEIQTRNLIEHPINWKVIEGVAAELLKRRTILSGELKGVIDRVLGIPECEVVEIEGKMTARPLLLSFPEPVQ